MALFSELLVEMSLEGSTVLGPHVECNCRLRCTFASVRDHLKSAQMCRRGDFVTELALSMCCLAQLKLSNPSLQSSLCDVVSWTLLHCAIFTGFPLVWTLHKMAFQTFRLFLFKAYLITVGVLGFRQAVQPAFRELHDSSAAAV